MKGTEKQIAYAKDIVAKTKEFIQKNIDCYAEKAEQYPKLFKVELEEWKKAQEWYNRQMVEAEKRDMPAAWYIENKFRIDEAAIQNKVKREVIRRENNM